MSLLKSPYKQFSFSKSVNIVIYEEKNNPGEIGGNKGSRNDKNCSLHIATEEESRRCGNYTSSEQ